jgi:putative glutamine amidotransferase
LIGISSSLFKIETGPFIGRERAAVGYDYVQAIKQAGGIPFILPIVENPTHIQRQIELVDGVLLSGGYDVWPLHYGEEPMPCLENICPQRDVYELELIRLAQQLSKPLLGICRGLQLLNVAFGGTLYQDIMAALPAALQHHQKAKPEEAMHTVELVEGTLLHQMMGTSTLLTNSYHHQAVKELAPGFRVNARAKDGLVEGIEKVGESWMLGVQWHPEFMVNKHVQMRKLFQALVEAASFSRSVS